MSLVFHWYLDSKLRPIWPSPRYCNCIASILILLATAWRSACAQVIVSEVMFDTGSDESRWEWIEVFNRGANDIDLNGYYLSRVGTSALAPTATPHILAANGGQTVVPAGGVAVVYDGQSLGFDGARFRNAWGLNSGTTLIGATSFPSLTNSGAAVGFWPSIEAHLQDTTFDVATERDLVNGLTHAAFGIDYSLAGFPRGNNSASIAWTGAGNPQAAANWQRSTIDLAGARQSVATTIEGIPLNSDLDVANPGILPPGNRPLNLLITEVMYNPRFGTTASNDAPWEWIEVYNGTNSPIDFTQQGYILDDHSDAGGTIRSPNVTTGRIEPSEVAILFDATLSAETFGAAWNHAGQTLNLIPVENFPSLGNGTETIAIWDSLQDYQADRAVHVENMSRAVSVLEYAAGNGWPSSTQGSSIYQVDLSANVTDGDNWQLSELDDSLSSWNARPVLGRVQDHEGGDIASPGHVNVVEQPRQIDFSGDQSVNSTDANLLVVELIQIASGKSPDVKYDVDRDGRVDHADLARWLNDAASVNGFAGSYLLGDANLDGSVTFTDFVALNNQWQRNNAAWIGGDFNADGSTDFLDFVALNNNWQRTIPTRASHAVVPEPVAASLLFAMIALRIAVRSLR